MHGFAVTVAIGAFLAAAVTLVLMPAALGVAANRSRRLISALTTPALVALAGLSWLTILKKRENYREAFHDFDYDRIANYTETDVKRLLADSGIVRNRLKIRSAIKNAQKVIEIQEEFGSLDAYLWRYVEGIPKQNKWTSMAELPVNTNRSDMMSKDLKKRGFNFVGSTICYAFMQAVGMVNDHIEGCHARAGCEAERASLTRPVVSRP